MKNTDMFTQQDGFIIVPMRAKKQAICRHNDGRINA